MVHRWRLWLAAGLVVIGAGGFEALPGVPGHTEASLLGDLALADAGAVVGTVTSPFERHPTATCASLESGFGVGNHLLRGAHIGWYASIWPSFQALKAMYVSSLLPGGRTCRHSFELTIEAIDAKYWDRSYRGSPAAFDQGPHAFHAHSDLPRVDDSLWMGLALVRGYQVTGDRKLLTRAEAVFRLARAEWDPAKGGIYWEYHTRRATKAYKAVVSNAPAVVLGAALFSVTGRRDYLTWSGRILRWLEHNLRDPRTGLYDDHVDDRANPPRIDTATLTYDQGIMVGAMASLAAVDPQHYSSGDAERLADRAMVYFAAHHSYGQPYLDAVWATNLLSAAGLSRSTAFAAQARASVVLAARAAPPASNRLLPDAGAATLRALLRLPADQYAKLSFLPS